MKKVTNTLITLTLSSAVATPALAEEHNQWFIGGDLGYSQQKRSGQIKDDNNEHNETSKDTGAAYTLKMGKYLGDSDEHRLTFSYNHADNKFDEDKHKYKQRNLLLSYDYLVGLNQDDSIRWFIGGTAGAAFTDMKQSELDKSTDFVYGAQTGFNFAINSNFEAELGYRYLKQGYDESSQEGGTTSRFQLKDTNELYLGVAYKF